jgi:hypothetical protein
MMSIASDGKQGFQMGRTTLAAKKGERYEARRLFS